MATQHITKYRGTETCDFCAGKSVLESSYKSIKLYFCYKCLFGSNQNIVLPINIISRRFNIKCNDCEKLSIYKLENNTQTTYYCYYHICPNGQVIQCL